MTERISTLSSAALRDGEYLFVIVNESRQNTPIQKALQHNKAICIPHLKMEALSGKFMPIGNADQMGSFRESFKDTDRMV